MSAVAGVEVEQVDGEYVIRRKCADCAVPFSLKCGTDEPDMLVQKFSRLVSLCESCKAKDDQALERAEGERRAGARLKQSGLPAGLRGLRFGDMIESEGRGKAIAAAEVWAAAREERARGLLLWGSVGSGKTRLAGTAAWARLQRFPVRYVSVAVLIAQLQAAFSDADRQEAIRVLTGTGGLVLDDLDKVRPTEQVVSQLFAAIDRRIQAGAPLLITTNEDPRKLEERFGEAIASRVAGYCLGRMFELTGPDRRLELGQS